MKETNKNAIIAIMFCFMLGFVFILNLCIKDEEISSSERRKLKQFPQLSINEILNGKLSNQFEEYAMDQFVARDFFRSSKSYVKLDLLRQKDNNDLFVKDVYIYKLEYPLNKNSVKNAADKINNICEKYFKENNRIYYAIIPDKNYFLDDNSLKMDYKELEKIMNNDLSNMKYINLFPLLKIEDYYKTDTHWKQENLKKIVNKIAKEMNILERIQTPYIEKFKGDFYGVYYGQLGRKMEGDKIKYLTNQIIEESITYNYETKKTTKIYDNNKWNTSLDKYDYFLSGATPIIRIDNPNAKSQRELIVFRDSFGSSLIPLLTEAYSTITIIDIRYISTDYLVDYIKITNQDVLFLYSTLILNQSSTLK